MSAAEARQRTFTRAPAPAPTVTVRPVAAAVQLSSMRVSQRGDPAEREAESTAKKIMRMEATPYMARFADSARLIARSGPPAPNSAPGGVGAEINAARGGGSPMPMGLRGFMESRFQADFSRVRIHTGDTAAKLSRSVSAHAFTVGNEIFFGKDKYQPETTEGKELLAHELTHTVQQGGATQEARRSEDTSVGERSSPHIARLGLSDALDFFARQANNIPGFRMFTIVLGVNPISMSRVDRSAANILRAVVEFIPGGGLIVQALDAYGVFDRAGRWIEQQLAGLGITGAGIQQAVNRFIESLGVTDLFNLGAVWDRATRIFSEPIDRIMRLLRSAGAEIIRMIKDAVLRPLAELASRTRGWDLLCAVLGRNPITGEAVPRTAETLIGGFMRLIGQEEVWQNIQRSGAVGRAWAWFQGALGSLMGFVSRIPQMFLDALRALEIADLVVLPRALLRVGSAFASFAAEFFTWAGNAVWSLLEIVFSVVAPGAMDYLRRAREAFRNILRNPIGFIGNLVRAAIQGFRAFGQNFLQHLRTALIGWLTGAMAGANIYIPQAFNLREIIKFVLSVLGLTWQNIRQKLVRAIGETAVRVLETAFDIVMTLVTEGPAAAWEKIREQITNLQDMVIEQVITFVRDRIITAAITRLVSSLNPAGAFVQAIIAIYNTIMFFVERMRQLIDFVRSAIDAIHPISIGDITRAAAAMERGLVQGLTLVISFLARLIGLGRVSDAVTNVINRIRQPIDRALDRVVEWIVTMARRAGRFIAQAGVPQDPNERLRLGRQAALAAINRFAASRVGDTVLRPLLAAIKVRYGFSTLDVLPRGGRWNVRGRINPEFDDVTEAFTPQGVAPEGQRTLLVGEGNFSFAVSIAAKVQVGGRVVATDFVVDERKTLERTANEQRRAAVVAANIAKLAEAGVQVERQVDAQDPATYPEGTFDVIVFNHPLVLTRRADGRTVRGGERATIDLIAGFLRTAKERIREGGRIVIISSRFRLQRWQLDAMANRLGLEQRVMNFLASDFPGYQHEMTESSGAAGTVGIRPEFAVVFTIRANRTT